MSGNASSVLCVSHRLPGSWPGSIEPRADARPEAGPVQRVIDIVELCEHILGYLTCVDLSRARGVCRQFDAVIMRSPIMQQDLFFRPCMDPTIWATPADCLLFTESTATRHIATAKLKRRPRQDLVVYELHPYLRVSHVG